MNNKRGGFGAKLLLVLVLMIASAVGGAFCYSRIDGKFAVSDAKKEIALVETEDLDSEAVDAIEESSATATTKLEAAKTRKAAYEILIDFKKDVTKIKADYVKRVAEAEEQNNQQQYYYNNDNNTDNSNATGYDENPDGNYDFVNPSEQSSSEKKSILDVFGN